MWIYLLLVYISTQKREKHLYFIVAFEAESLKLLDFFVEVKTLTGKTITLDVEVSNKTLRVGKGKLGGLVADSFLDGD